MAKQIEQTKKITICKLKGKWQTEKNYYNKYERKMLIFLIYKKP